MDFKKTSDNIDQVDTLLDKLWKFLGKHWGKLLIILICYGIYLFIGMVSDEMNKEVEEPYIVETYEEIDESGETIIIEVWSDGVYTFY